MGKHQLNLRGNLNDLIKAAMNDKTTSHFAVIIINRSDISKYPPYRLEIPLDYAKKINTSRTWDTIKEVLGGIYGDDIIDISLSIPLQKRGSEFYLRISRNSPIFEGILSSCEG